MTPPKFCESVTIIRTRDDSASKNAVTFTVFMVATAVFDSNPVDLEKNTTCGFS